MIENTLSMVNFNIPFVNNRYLKLDHKPLFALLGGYKHFTIIHLHLTDIR